MVLLLPTGNHPVLAGDDLAGPWTLPLPVGQRIRRLSDRYLRPDVLSDRLEDLPQQFYYPRPRPWPLIAWEAIAPDQVRAMALPTFCQILRGTINT
ncbi:hypothetical protein C7271_14235, partial [filamentous cyanobacterium CCP5]